MGTPLKTTKLFTTPNFTSGMGSVLNIQGSYYSFKTSKSAEEADLDSLYSDWKVVGDGIRDACQTDKESNINIVNEQY